jgi:hypothetical protein
MGEVDAAVDVMRSGIIVCAWLQWTMRLRQVGVAGMDRHSVMLLLGLLWSERLCWWSVSGCREWAPVAAAV